MPDTQSSPKQSDEGDPYVFISYARPDQAAAEKVESFLASKPGIRVFRDTRDIHPGDNWDLIIEQALRECNVMVLLLSSSSMPDRKEVHREWFHFDQNRKPIIPLYIEDCRRQTRFESLNYIDARHDLGTALELLLAELRRSDFSNESGFKKTGAVVSESLKALRDQVLNDQDDLVVSEELALVLKDHKPSDLTEYRLTRIAEWSLPRYAIDKRFVNLTLIVDKGQADSMRWQPVPAEEFSFNDLRDVLKSRSDDPAMVLLGAPGSGKSTLLSRFQLDHSIDCLREGAETISFFIPLNSYRARPNGERPDPSDWLASRWKMLYPLLPSIETYLQKGKALLLLDALNEMPHKDADEYLKLVESWRGFTQDVVRQGNRIVFSCRSLDYSAPLSSPDLPVPQIRIQPMNSEQVRGFLNAYTPSHKERIWRELNGSPQFELFQTPYFLKLLCEQVEASGDIPKGRAALFTGFVRKALLREIHGELFRPGSTLTEFDHQKVLQGQWRNDFDLPDRSPLIPKLSDMAFTMQEKGLKTESAQVRIDIDEARALVGDEKIIRAGEALNVLDRNLAEYELLFFHQLLQEYFAARQLAKEPKPESIRVEWEVDKVRPALAEILAGLGDGDPLPPLQQTGWEETTLTAAPMAANPEALIRTLMQHNLTLAAKCAASPEVKIDDALKHEIQDGLIERMRSGQAEIRARIAAGEALGLIGDPRFQRQTVPHGDCLLPPMVEIPGGIYPVGDDKGIYDFEKPAGKVNLAPFQIGKFPLTNAEYKCFIDAGGYEQEQWWDTDESKAWLSGEAAVEGQKASWRDTRKLLLDWTDDRLRGLVAQNRITSKQADDYIVIRNWTEEKFEEWLEEQFPSGTIYRQPRFWEDSLFNNPSQPVVGVTWFEARAYCNWLTANAGGELNYVLPTEAQYEAAARGVKGRLYAYGNEFDLQKCNTFESHIRRSTPVGIFDNATPEGAFDLSGNVWSWTLSIYDQQQFPYPYRIDDGREEIDKVGVKRVLRGGSWDDDRGGARAVYRDGDRPASRSGVIGVRVVGLVSSPFS